MLIDLTRHFAFMAVATFVAYRALQNTETPVACIFVHEPTQKILSFGCNDTNRSLNGTRHAEFLAIDKILEEHGLLNSSESKIHSFFSEVVLYVTVEPCVMCALALKQLGLGKVYFGAANDRFGGNGTVLKVQAEKYGATYQSYGGIMRVEAIHLLRLFYIQENDTAPVPKANKNKDIEGKGFPPNLDFGKYLSKEEFGLEFGPERTELFFTTPHPTQEITPKLNEGYSIGDLLTAEMVQLLPHIGELYPDQNMEIERDIRLLNELLPMILNNGEVDLEGSEGTKKRKLSNN